MGWFTKQIKQLVRKEIQSALRDEPCSEDIDVLWECLLLSNGDLECAQAYTDFVMASGELSMRLKCLRFAVNSALLSETRHLGERLTEAAKFYKFLTEAA